MIKVLVIIEDGRGGGALFRIIQIAKMIERQVKTIVLCPYEGERFQNALEHNRIEYRVVNIHKMSKTFWGSLQYLFTFIPDLFRIRKVIKEANPDIVHVNSSSQIKGIVAGRICNKRIVWHMNDTRQPWIIRRAFTVLSNLANGFIYASNASRSYYERSSNISTEQQSVVIPAPVDLNKIDYKERNNRKSRFRVLTIGYINRNKGLELLMGTISNLDTQKYIFDIVGPILKTQQGYYLSLKRLKEKLALRNVNFKGFQTIDGDLLGQYDFYICSSHHESSPIAIWQAMASGMPVISTDVGDVRRIMEDYDCGFISEEFTPEALANLCEKLVSLSNDQYSEKSINARSAAKACFNGESISKSYIRFYSELLGDTQG